MVLSFGWYPFAIKGYSVSQTNEIIWRGLWLWSAVSNIQFVGSSNPHIIFSGSASRTWAAATYQNSIMVSTAQTTDAEWWSHAIAHEFGHTWGAYYLPGLGHANRKESIMHPNGSIYRYFDYVDGKFAVRKYGYPRKMAWPRPLQKEGAQIRDYQSKISKAKSDRQSLINKRDKEPNRETDKAKRIIINDKIKKLNVDISTYYRELKKHSDTWLRIKNEWNGLLNRTYKPIEMPETMNIEQDDRDPIICGLSSSFLDSDGLNSPNAIFDMSSISKEIKENIKNQDKTAIVAG